MKKESKHWRYIKWEGGEERSVLSSGTYRYVRKVKNDYFQKKLDGYEFPVYSTEVCPRNQTEWNARSSAINCTSNNGYMCIPNRELTKLLEFCYVHPFIWIEKSKHCFYFCKQDRK